MEMQNLVVVITGASSGIGRATALELAQQGASLVLVARREQALYALAEECRRLGGTALPVPTDVSIEDHVYGVAQKTVNRFGKIDVWINNAAVTAGGAFEDVPMQDFRRVIDINLFGCIYGSRAAVHQFRKQGRGTIINIASVVALVGEPYFTSYATSKFGIRGFSQSLNQELINDNIQVCVVLPGVIDTPIYNQAANYMGKAMKAPGHAIPAEEVAAAIIGLIRNPKPEIYVGSKGRLTFALRSVAPKTFDRESHERILRDHFDQEKDVPVSTGNLYDPMKEYASVSGGWGQPEEENMMKYILPASLITGAAIGLALVFRKKRLSEAKEQ